MKIINWKKAAMAMSLSADDEDYESDCEQVSTAESLQAGDCVFVCVLSVHECVSSQDNQEIEPPGVERTDSVTAQRPCLSLRVFDVGMFVCTCSCMRMPCLCLRLIYIFVRCIQ